MSITSTPFVDAEPLLLSAADKMRHNGKSRAAAMALLARAEAELLQVALDQYWSDVSWRALKPAATGLVMLRGRIGGDGAPFNVGEATISKAVIELDDGTRGYGQCLGRDAKKAELAALFDALWHQDEPRVEALVLKPIRDALALKRQTQAAETAATKVDFFTLVRGED